MDKVKMTYKVNKGRNPQTGATILVPRVSRKPKMTLKQLVAFAKDTGFVRGQLKDLEGLLNGFIEAMQNRAEAGYTVNVNDWFIISGDLAGQVGEDRQLTSANTYHINIRTSKALKVGIENFSWSREDEAALMRLESLTSPHGNKGEVTADKDIVANGRNVFFDAAKGDTATFVYVDDATGEPVELAALPSELSETYLRFAAIPALEGARAGSSLKLIVNAHDETGALQTATQSAKLLAAPAPTVPTIRKVTSQTTGNVNEWKPFRDTTIVEGFCLDGATPVIELVSRASGAVLATIAYEDGNVLTHEGDNRLTMKIIANTTPQPDGVWESASNYVRVRLGDQIVELERV